MVNQHARREFAREIRNYLSGRISNYELEGNIPWAGSDPAIDEIFNNGVYSIYSDRKEHYHSGDYKLNKDGTKVIAQWILFLYSGSEYRWPSYRGNFLQRFVQILTLSFPKEFSFGSEKFRAAGDFHVWPFISRSEYEQALANPPFFNLRRAVQER